MVVPLKKALHIPILIAFLVSQINHNLVKCDIKIVLTTNTVNCAVQLKERLSAIEQFAYQHAHQN
ncbi:hypothetical protein, partial [Enterobacter hormaechei]